VRREGWALHNLFSLNLVKWKKREREKGVWECGAWEKNCCSVLLQPLSLPQDLGERSPVTPASQVGTRGMDEGS